MMYFKSEQKNNQKGFTLIELLAVIVILAIISLIAVPIVVNIIKQNKDNATLRSADFYLDAVEQSIVRARLKNQKVESGKYSIMSDGNICLGTLIDDTCIGIENRENNENDILKVEVKGEVPKSGTITVENKKVKDVKLKYSNFAIAKNEKGQLVYINLLENICTPAPADEQLYTTNPLEAGYKYKCKVDPNKDVYTFYVLTTPSADDKSINLIMDQNINSDGTPAGMTPVTKTENPSQYNLVVWLSQEDYELANGKNWSAWADNNTFGPLTAMKFLQEATKNWTNTNLMTVTTFQSNAGKSYLMAESYTSYARMPIYLNDSTKSEVYTETSKNAYLYDNLTAGKAPHGYWTSSRNVDNFRYATCVKNARKTDNHSLNLENAIGVRPVINLSI